MAPYAVCPREAVAVPTDMVGRASCAAPRVEATTNSKTVISGRMGGF
jgi:hypothetical protein